MNKPFWAITLIGCLLWQTVLPVSAQTGNIRYLIEDLGAFGANQRNASYANGINSVGQVVGTAQADAGGFFPFRWTNGTMQNLGSFGGVNDRFSGAAAINDFGFVTGALKTANNKNHAFLFNNSGLIDLGIGGAGFPSGTDETFGRGINNRGEIVGYQGNSSVYAGFYYDGATLRNLNNLIPAGSNWTISFANDINDKRQIVGGGFRAGIGGQSPFRFDMDGGVTYIGVSNPGSSTSSAGSAINNLGKSVGFFQFDPAVSAFTHSDSVGNSFLSTSFSPCSSNGSFPLDVNTRGTIVGVFYSFSSGPNCNLPLFQNRAVLWQPSGQGVDLNNLIDSSLGWTLREATDINDRGQIVGNGTRVINGAVVERAFRLTPIRPQNNQVSDFDGDGRTDLAVYRPNGGFWYVLQSSNNSFAAAQFGIASDKLAPGDYDGDGRTDYAVYRDGLWFVLNSGNNSFRAVRFNFANDTPTAADFDADGKTDMAVFRPSNGIWYVRRSSDDAFVEQPFGQAGDKPAVGDYDADGRADFAVFRPSNGFWYVLQSTLGFGSAQFGTATDKPVQGDYDGDGRTDFAVFRPEHGTWYLLRSQSGFSSQQFGIAADEPAPGDFDGDGKFDLGVYRAGSWYLQQSTNGFRAAQFGVADDKPIPAAYLSAGN